MAGTFPHEPEFLIEQLSHRPSHLIRAMIKTDLPESLCSIPLDHVWTERASSLGILDRLPPEVMLMILDMLDVKSAVLFSRASTRCCTYVRSQRAYRALATSAPHMLFALSKVGLLGVHRVDLLHTALRTEKCAYCREYGPFLFLPT